MKNVWVDIERRWDTLEENITELEDVAIETIKKVQRAKDREKNKQSLSDQ